MSRRPARLHSTQPPLVSDLPALTRALLDEGARGAWNLSLAQMVEASEGLEALASAAGTELMRAAQRVVWADDATGLTDDVLTTAGEHADPFTFPPRSTAYAALTAPALLDWAAAQAPPGSAAGTWGRTAGSLESALHHGDVLEPRAGERALGLGLLSVWATHVWSHQPL